MAENKKSFILYVDLITTVSKLPDDIAGRLFKTILAYVNDQDPILEELLLQIAFEPIKMQLKRDLVSWEETKVNRSKSGHLGGVKSGESRRKKQNEAKRSTASNNEAPLQITKQNEANEAVNVNVNVNDTVFIKIGLRLLRQSPSSWLKENKGIAITNLMLSELKGVDQEAIYKQMDGEYNGYDFGDPNHVYNTFKLIGKRLKNNYSAPGEKPAAKLDFSFATKYPKST